MHDCGSFRSTQPFWLKHVLKVFKMGKKAFVKPRARLTDGDGAVIAALKPWVTCKLWISYSTSLTGVADRAALIAKSGLLSKFDKPLTQKTVVDALHVIAEPLDFFQMQPCHVEDWKKTCATRLRAMHRHWVAAVRKGSTWVQKYVAADGQSKGKKLKEAGKADGKEEAGKADGKSKGKKLCESKGKNKDKKAALGEKCEKPASTDAKKADKKLAKADGKSKGAPSSEKTYLVGWDRDIHKAWRLLDGVKKKDYTHKVFVHDDEQDASDFCWATWDSDKYTARLTDLTVEEYLKKKRNQASRKLHGKSAQRFFSGFKGKAEVVVKARQDRGPLLISLVYDKRQKCSLAVKPPFETNEVVAEIMVQLAEEFVAKTSTLAANSLYARRDEIIKEKGYTIADTVTQEKTGAKVCKRPAASAKKKKKEETAGPVKEKKEETAEEKAEKNDEVPHDAKGKKKNREQKKRKREYSAKSKLAVLKRARKAAAAIAVDSDTEDKFADAANDDADDDDLGSEPEHVPSRKFLGHGSSFFDRARGPRIW